MIDSLEQMVDAFERGRLSRRGLITRLGAMFAAAAGVRTARAAEQKSVSTFQARAINHVALRVEDVPRARDFYVKHLGLEVISDSERSCFLDCGPDFLALFSGNTPGLDHYCYTISNYDPSAAVETLKSAGLDPIRHENRVYFKDADGIEVQVSAPNE